MDTPDSEALDRSDMARLVRGEELALNALLERHATPVFRFLCRLLGNEEDANDLAQETFVRVYRSRESYRPSQRFIPWLYTIAANLARNQLRWRSRHPSVPLEGTAGGPDASWAGTLPADAPDPLEHVTAGERIAAVRAAVRALPDDLREALVLCEWEGRAVAEAAGILGTTTKAVESRLFRARRLLRERLACWL
jgi:RNA polymerase sigma-70 factor (ECF subfamily)